MQESDTHGSLPSHLVRNHLLCIGPRLALHICVHRIILPESHNFNDAASRRMAQRTTFYPIWGGYILLTRIPLCEVYIGPRHQGGPRNRIQSRARKPISTKWIRSPPDQEPNGSFLFKTTCTDQSRCIHDFRIQGGGALITRLWPCHQYAVI